MWNIEKNISNVIWVCDIQKAILTINKNKKKIKKIARISNHYLYYFHSIEFPKLEKWNILSTVENAKRLEGNVNQEIQNGIRRTNQNIGMFHFQT